MRQNPQVPKQSLCRPYNKHYSRESRILEMAMMRPSFLIGNRSRRRCVGVSGRSFFGGQVSTTPRLSSPVNTDLLPTMEAKPSGEKKRLGDTRDDARWMHACWDHPASLGLRSRTQAAVRPSPPSPQIVRDRVKIKKRTSGQLTRHEKSNFCYFFHPDFGLALALTFC